MATEGILEAVCSPSGSVTAHIRQVGDTEGKLGDWIGIRGSGLSIEGICIMLKTGIANDEIEYQILQDYNMWLPWVKGSEFCGTRGMSLPIRGLRLRLRGAAATKFDCIYSAAFVDGTETGLLPSESICAASTMAPLEAFQIILRPHAGLPVCGPKGGSEF